MGHPRERSGAKPREFITIIFPFLVGLKLSAPSSRLPRRRRRKNKVEEPSNCPSDEASWRDPNRYARSNSDRETCEGKPKAFPVSLDFIRKKSIPRGSKRKRELNFLLSQLKDLEYKVSLHHAVVMETKEERCFSNAFLRLPLSIPLGYPDTGTW